MILDVPSLSTWATASRRPRSEWPNNTKRSSNREWMGSAMVIESGSPKAVAASANETPCFARLRAAFSRSHSNCITYSLDFGRSYAETLHQAKKNCGGRNDWLLQCASKSGPSRLKQPLVLGRCDNGTDKKVKPAFGHIEDEVRQARQRALTARRTRRLV
jgi:hypothetical protein